MKTERFGNASLGLLQTEMTYFTTLLYTSASEIPTFHISEAWK